MSEYIDNTKKRKEALKRLILDLHAGGDLEEIKAHFRDLIGDVSAIEVARLEQELIDEGLPAEQITKLCDVHVAVFKEALDGQASPEMTPGHPVHTFKYENFALGEVLKLLDGAIAELPDEGALKRARAFAGQLADVNKIYLRKENLLFPFLEKHEVIGPSAVMWSTHDEVRAQLKAFRQALEAGDIAQITEIYAPLATTIRQMFYKEEHILYPTALKLLSDAEWLAIRDQSGEIGYCLICPGDQWQPDTTEAAELPKATSYQVAGDAEIELDTGGMTPEQVNLVLTHLPIDVTLVDENDVVRYSSQGPKRIFVRAPAIIGRKVQNCHPPDSVHIVNRILDEMREGTRDTADFWIQMGGQFVYIRYIALHDKEGAYRGCIEVTQELSGIRALEGEHRLLDDA